MTSEQDGALLTCKAVQNSTGASASLTVKLMLNKIEVNDNPSEAFNGTNNRVEVSQPPAAQSTAVALEPTTVSPNKTGSEEFSFFIKTAVLATVCCLLVLLVLALLVILVIALTSSKPVTLVKEYKYNVPDSELHHQSITKNLLVDCEKSVSNFTNISQKKGNKIMEQYSTYIFKKF